MKPKKTEISNNDSGWLMTYGDMMTLILTFFVMLFSTNQQPISKVLHYNFKI